MKTGVQTAKRVKESELRSIAEATFVPEGAVDLCLVVVSTEGDRLPNGDFAGKGGTTRFGPAWMTDEGRGKSEPIALFESQLDARKLWSLIAGPEGELWNRREARRARIAALIEAETAAEKEAVETAKKTRRLERAGVDVKDATGGGSSRRSRSSEKRTASTGKRLVATMPESLPA